ADSADVADVDAVPVREVASRDVVTVGPDDPVLAVLRRILEEGVEHVPVAGPDGRLAGICTRTDVLRARRRQFDLEQPQPGWRLGKRAIPGRGRGEGSGLP